jgi:hypothetical protein
MSEPSSISSALTKATPAPAPSPPAVDISSGVFSGIAAFEAAQRMAQALCTSTMVPSEYRGQQGLSNSLIALEIAARMGLSPLVVMQNMTPIHGKPSWSSSFLIATVNASGRFSPLRFVFDDKETPSSCFAVARDKASGEVLEGQTISIEMAKQEGWWSRPDRYGKETSKWQSMTGQMLRYRAAAFWVKVYCPEISLGLMTQDEVADVQAVEVAAVVPIAASPAVAAPSMQGPAIPQLLGQPLTRSTAVSAAAPETDLDDNTQAGTAAKVEESPAPRRSPRRSTPAQKRPEDVAQTDPSETPATPAAELAALDQPGQIAQAHQTELSAEPAPDPKGAAAVQPSATALLGTALQEIPKLASAAALENARQRVNRLLAEGQLSDDGAERLWSAIDRRLKQLQITGAAAAEPQQVS